MSIMDLVWLFNLTLSLGWVQQIWRLQESWSGWVVMGLALGYCGRGSGWFSLWGMYPGMKRTGVFHSYTAVLCWGGWWLVVSGAEIGGVRRIWAVTYQRSG